MVFRVRFQCEHKELIMRIIVLGLIGSIVLAMSTVAVGAAEYGKHYVLVPILNERSGPGTGFPVVNKVYKGDALTVRERQDGWARVTPDGFKERWVFGQLISKTKPTAAPQPKLYEDPRIGGAPEAGGYMTDADIKRWYAGAKKVLDSGRCSKIDWGDKSTRGDGSYYVVCDDLSKHYFK